MRKYAYNGSLLQYCNTALLMLLFAGLYLLNLTHHVSASKTPEYCECGKNPLQNTRIFGGSAVVKGKYPWYVTITRDSRVICGGTLINKKFVVTAAHCFMPMTDSAHYVAIFNAYNLEDFDISTSLIRYIKEIRIHPGYEENRENDIAVVKLFKALKFDGIKVAPICLPPPGLSLEGKTAMINGFGSTEYGGPGVGTMMEVDIKIHNDVICKSQYEERYVPESHICASNPNKDACTGDSGGPLMVTEDGTTYLVGVVSFGYKCGDSGHSGVYTKMEKFLPWLTKNSKTHSKCSS